MLPKERQRPTIPSVLRLESGEMSKFNDMKKSEDWKIDCWSCEKTSRRRIQRWLRRKWNGGWRKHDSGNLRSGRSKMSEKRSDWRVLMKEQQMMMVVVEKSPRRRARRQRVTELIADGRMPIMIMIEGNHEIPTIGGRGKGLVVVGDLHKAIATIVVGVEPIPTRTWMQS